MMNTWNVMSWTCVAAASLALGCTEAGAPEPTSDTAQASASGPTRVQMSWGTFASAAGSFSDSCYSLDFEVFGRDQTIVTSGEGHEAQNVSSAHIFGFNRCAGTVIDGGGDVAGFNGDLEGAVITVDFLAVEYLWPGGSPDDPLRTPAISVTGTLTGTGEIEINESHQTSGDCPACSTYDEESQVRSATATIEASIDGEPVAVTPFFANLRTLQWRNVEHIPD
jgi:hypothetical protein